MEKQLHLGDNLTTEEFYDATVDLRPWKHISVPVINNRIPIEICAWIAKRNAKYVKYDLTPEDHIDLWYIAKTKPPRVEKKEGQDEHDKAATEDT